MAYLKGMPALSLGTAAQQGGIFPSREAKRGGMEETMKKGKKALALLMATTMTMGLAACGDKNNDDKNSGNNDNSKPTTSASDG